MSRISNLTFRVQKKCRKYINIIIRRWILTSIRHTSNSIIKVLRIIYLTPFLVKHVAESII